MITYAGDVNHARTREAMDLPPLAKAEASERTQGVTKLVTKRTKDTSSENTQLVPNGNVYRACTVINNGRRDIHGGRRDRRSLDVSPVVSFADRRTTTTRWVVRSSVVLALREVAGEAEVPPAPTTYAKHLVHLEPRTGRLEGN